MLKAFVSGVSRFSPHEAPLELKNEFVRVDQVQNLFLASQRLKLPATICDELAYWSKRWLDRQSRPFVWRSNLFLFYSGCGLDTCRGLAGEGVICMVEAVNSHVLAQERLLQEEHAILGLPLPRFHRREVRRRVAEYELADAILCPSNFVAKSFVEYGFPPAKICVVPYGFTPQEFGPPDREQREGFRVLYVGQISVRKGIHYLLQAFEQLRHPEKRLTIVGPLAKPSGIENLTLPQGVEFTGALKGEALQNAYAAADVFVLPSIEEGLALVLGEAMASGLPVIATENTGADHLMTNGQEGFIVPIRNANAIALRLQELADDMRLRAKMSTHALERCKELGGWSQNAKSLIGALQDVAKTK
jgi:glycosyltransferase involved in cell wall biosynthesis